MKKIKLLAAFAAITAFSAPAFSIAQIGVNGNYTSDKFSNGTTFSGVGFSGFARFTAGIPLLVTFAFGPYVDYSSLSGGPASSPDAKQLRAGGELVVYLDVVGNVLGLTPYARFGYGYEGNTLKTTYTATGNTVASTADALYYGTGGHTLFGLTYKVLPLIYLFAEGGIQWSSLTASIPSAASAYVSASDLTTSGWRMSLGAMIWL
ncbi:MAG: hypothetical protein U1F27_07265 [Turneriella sp.]